MQEKSVSQLIVGALATMAGCWGSAVRAAEAPGFPMPARGAPWFAPGGWADIEEANRAKTGTSGGRKKKRLAPFG